MTVLIFIELLFLKLSVSASSIEVLENFTRLKFTGLKIILIAFLILPLIYFWISDKKQMFRRFIILYVFIDTFRLFLAIFELIKYIGEYQGARGGHELFTDVIFIWFINVIVFGVWYWILDAGGPEKRNLDKFDRRDFLFPQLSMKVEGYSEWRPDFVDYLFLAFNTSTTFGPTQTMVLSRRVKILMMIQVVASLTSFAVIAAKAVSIIQ